jgi:hypothetical protein
VESGLVSITPLRLDLTDGAELARLQKERPLQGAAGPVRTQLVSS